MQLIIIMVWCGILLVSSIIDLRTKKVPLYLIISSFVCAIIFLSINLKQGLSLVWYYHIGGLGIGMMFLMMSKLTQQAIGYADSSLILSCGLGLGMWPTFHILMISLFIAGIMGIILMIIHKMKRKSTFAFVPCITAAFIGIAVFPLLMG